MNAHKRKKAAKIQASIQLPPAVIVSEADIKEQITLEVVQEDVVKVVDPAIAVQEELQMPEENIQQEVSQAISPAGTRPYKKRKSLV